MAKIQRNSPERKQMLADRRYRQLTRRPTIKQPIPIKPPENGKRECARRINHIQ